ncbi:hypothetical protein [Hyphobacterium indicum]|uniref:hypothetical protein n=1 Tax=Hyphobacterium indicum TaxID=2162714 RepID=UPI000D64A014|nr:hypothetical protein [Hyphobacterium indicum]
MILQNISRAIREQDYYAVALEFVIVIAGVVIGFQITAWNGERVADERETALLVRLRDELETDQRERARSLNNSFRLERLRGAVEVMRGDAGADLTALQCNAIATSNYYSDASAGASVPAMEELLSDARGLNLISDVGLRQALADYLQYRASIPRTVDWYVRGSVNLTLRFPELIEQSAYVDPERQTIWPEVSCNLEAMRRDSAFRNAFSENAWRFEYYYQSVVAEHNDRVEALIARISEVLGDNHETGEANAENAP